ncbi:MAG: GAF domain-containing protein [Chloroflexi bacterium]|nr:GAF domain-containing protein [Chloroflexota bacterium]
MNQADNVFTQQRGSFLVTTLRRWLADTPLRFKLYVGLGTSIIGLLVVAIGTSYINVTNQQMMSRALDRQQQLADRTTEISDILLNIQTQAIEFYNIWNTRGFERVAEGGFERARTNYVNPIYEQIEQIRENIDEIKQAEPNEQTRQNLDTILQNMDAYETTIRQMSDQMESLGFAETGEIGQMRAVTADLQDWIDQPGLETLYITLLQIVEHEKEYFLHSDQASLGKVSEKINQLDEMIAAADGDLLTPVDKAELDTLLQDYRDYFFAATTYLNRVNESQRSLILQSDLTNILVSNMFKQQQDEFGTRTEQIQSRQFNTTLIIIGLAVLSSAVSGLVFYFTTSQIIRPVQMLGEAAERLGTGELDVRAVVHGRDEIGTAAMAFNSMADQLQAVLTDLEQRVAARVRSLQTAAEISHAITSVLDPDELLNRVVHLIRERFDLYYAGLFLVTDSGTDFTDVDTKEKFAVLRAGTGSAGRKMLELGHKLGVGSESMIGQCVSKGEARIALDVGEEAVRFVNPHLPDTRSEMALPLRARGQVLGAMSVQSIEEAAFDEADISVLQTVADQVAVAIDNARLFADTQAALEEMETIQRRYLGQAWTKYLHTTPKTSYETERPGVPRLDQAVLPEIRQAVAQKDTVIQQDANHSALVTPIALRGAVIGALGIHTDHDRQWTDDEIALINAVAERMAVAADNLRLLDETQRRAAREQLVGEIASRVRTSMDPDAILKTAVQELGRALGARMATIQVTGPGGNNS